MKNCFFKLPFSFDVEKLKEELSFCERTEWKIHFNRKDFSGNWTSIALRSATGNEKDVFAHPQTTSFTNTPLMEQCAYFRSIVELFECEKESVRLLSLCSGSVIKEHRDMDAGYESNFFRIHIPIQTNPAVSFKVNGTELKMNEGECWYANFNLPHSVANNGPSNRIHLVIDCKRNAWSDHLFASMGYDFEFEKQEKPLDKETAKKMIEELKKINSETSNKLIEQLQKQIES